MDPEYFARDAPTVAADLIGYELLHEGVGGLIVETEAYDRANPASHSFAGPTRRNASMFGPSGRAYVYRSYGLHWCFNIVCAPGSAVLVRALEPTVGLDAMHERRSMTATRLLCSGPGRLCQALAITGAHDCCALEAFSFTLTARNGPMKVANGVRIGNTRVTDTPWRFVPAGSAFISRPLTLRAATLRKAQ